MTINPICHLLGWGFSFTTEMPMRRPDWPDWKGYAIGDWFYTAADRSRARIRIGTWEFLCWKSSFKKR